MKTKQNIDWYEPIFFMSGLYVGAWNGHVATYQETGGYDALFEKEGMMVPPPSPKSSHVQYYISSSVNVLHL